MIKKSILSNINWIFSVLLILILISIYLFYYNSQSLNRKTIGILGSVSKKIEHESELKREIKKLAENLPINYNYIIPNAKKGIIGYLLENINPKIYNNIETHASNAIPDQDYNKNFKIIYSDTIEDYEINLVVNNDIYIFLPGGIGTTYEIYFSLLLSEFENKKIIFLNHNDFFTPIQLQIKNLETNGYLRESFLKNYKTRVYFARNADQVLQLIA